MKKPTLPPRVFEKGASYYLVRAEGKKRIWIRLCAIKDGLPAMHQALGKLLAEGVTRDTMPALIDAWKLEEMPRHTSKTQRDDIAICAAIAQAFPDARPAQIKTPHVVEYLKPLRDRPRTHNAHRAMLRELMRFAEVKGLRKPQSNPVSAVKTMRTAARDRYITDSELRRIKVAGIYGDDGRITRSGRMLAALVDVAYLTGQRIGDLLDLVWRRQDAMDSGGKVVAPYIGRDGIHFKPGKTRHSTGAAVLVAWTPRLRDVVQRLQLLREERGALVPQVFVTQEGQAYTYWGASTAWRRAVKRSGVAGVTFHDLRAKALTDKEAHEGIVAAQHLGAHSTQAQTSDYVRAKKARQTKAVR